MEINYALIGKRIRETRKQRGLSAEELAEIADLSTVYISYIENAKRKPSLESLIKISNALEITIDELLYGNLLYNPDVYKRQVIENLSFLHHLLSRKLPNYFSISLALNVPNCNY